MTPQGDYQQNTDYGELQDNDLVSSTKEKMEKL